MIDPMGFISYLQGRSDRAKDASPVELCYAIKVEPILRKIEGGRAPSRKFGQDKNHTPPRKSRGSDQKQTGS